MSTRKRRPSPSRPRPAQGRADEPVVVRVADPPGMVAALAPMLGFVPEESVVVLAMRRTGTGGGRGSSRVVGMARIDLPADGDTAAAEVLAEAARRRLSGSGVEEVLVVVIGGADPEPAAGGERGGGSGRPPHGVLVDALVDEFAAGRVDVPGSIWVPRIAAGAPWRCYERCDCSGVLDDPGSTVAAAATAALGRVTYSSRAEVERLLASEPAASGPRRRVLVDEARAAALLDRAVGGPAAVRRDLDAVRHAAAETARGHTLGDEEIARLAVALGDPAVRDVCLGFAHGHDPAVEPAAAESLWTALVRAVPAPEVAEPAILLACACLAAGGGPILSVALERVHRADPEHRLGLLVGRLLASGVDGERVRQWIADAVAEAGQALGA